MNECDKSFDNFIEIEKCIFLSRCLNVSCRKIHPDETLNGYKQRIECLDEKQKIYKDAFKIINNKNQIKKYFEKSKFCKYSSSCMQGKYCTYAHSLDEYVPPSCIYKNYCINPSCMLYHQNRGESKEEYMKKHNISIPAEYVKREPPKIKEETFRMDLCGNMSYKKRCEDKNCTLAHYIWEISPKKCDKKDCTCGSLHNNEDKFDYCNRMVIFKRLKIYNIDESYYGSLYHHAPVKKYKDVLLNLND